MQERARRKAEREKGRRAAAGATGRDQWLVINSQETSMPWVSLGISRGTFFRRKIAALRSSGDVAGSDSCETGPCPQREAMPGGRLRLKRNPTVYTPTIRATVTNSAELKTIRRPLQIKTGVGMSAAF